jgi:homocysteine S-methyltransferase
VNDLERLLSPDHFTVIDGGLSTQLEIHGHDLNDPLWTARVLLNDPSMIERAHRDFIDAGAQFVITASYQVSRPGFLNNGLSAHNADEALAESVHAARRATAGTRCLVAASVGPYGAILHDGSEYRGNYGVKPEFLVNFHAERLAVLADAQPDFFAVETIPDLTEVRALAEALEDYSDIPFWMSFSAADGGHLNGGAPIEIAAAVAASISNIAALGINCTAPEHITELATRIRSVTELPLIAYPNAGGSWDPHTAEWSMTNTNPFTEENLTNWRDAGVEILGGCCGVDAQMMSTLTR